MQTELWVMADSGPCMESALLQETPLPVSPELLPGHLWTPYPGSALLSVTGEVH